MAIKSKVAQRLRRRPPEPTEAVTHRVGTLDSVMSGWMLAETDEIFRGMPIGPEDLVVDVGCGDGAQIQWCAQRGPHVIAVDIDAEALGQVRSRLADSPARTVEVIEARGEDLPLDDGVATKVICAEVLEHVDDPVPVLAELARIGAPGALYLLTVPGALGEKLQEHVAPPSYFEPPNHIRTIEQEQLRAWVEGAGLEILSYQTYGFFWTVWWALFWASDAPLEDPRHPLLDGWSATWESLLQMERGQYFKDRLDAFMPKSQVIIARKPAD